MKFTDIFKLSTRMFKARTSRTLLTILGMSIGIGAILFLVSLGYGLQRTLLERITTSDSLVTLDVTEASSDEVVLNQETVSEISDINGVTEVSPAFQINGQGKFNNLSADVSIMGTQPSFLRLGGFRVLHGVLLSDENPNGIIIDKAVVRVFGKDPDKPEDVIGQQIKFSFSVPDETAANATANAAAQKNYHQVDSDQSFVIVGIAESEDNVVYINSQALTALNINHYSQLKVKCANGNLMTRIRDQILGIRTTGSDDAKVSKLVVSALSDTVDQANKIFGAIQIILMLFGIVALVVSAIGMFNTMTIALLERTEEIGIMKSIGASDFAVSMMFMMESSIMGFFGGVAGVAIGFVGGQLSNILINLIATRFGGTKVSLFYSPLWFVLTIVMFAAFVGFSTGIVPARRASKIDPLDALRYK